jgi:LacI family transcriptional regulator
MSVTIYEIAEQAGVSSSTVARILRGDAREKQLRSAATAKRIRKIATELGYRPNVVARAFSRGCTHGVGLLYTDDAWIFEGVNMDVVNSLVRSLQREGYHLVFCPVDESGSWERIVLGGQIDGGVVFQALPMDVANAVRERQLPLVVLGDNSDPRLSQVVVDDFAGAYAATKHLLGLGHTRVMMFVHESIKPHCSVDDRLRGYRTAMHEAGLPVNECIRTSEGEAVANLVRGEERPTGVVCYSDLESTLLVHSSWQYGVAIPKDVSLVGFNDVFNTRMMTPPLTTVGFDAAKIGEHGARLLLELIGAADTARKPSVVMVKPTLIVRGSTGPVRTGGDFSDQVTHGIASEVRGVEQKCPANDMVHAI